MTFHPAASTPAPGPPRGPALTSRAPRRAPPSSATKVSSWARARFCAPLRRRMVGALVARCQVASASCGECTEVQARTAATWRVLVPAAGVVRRPPAHFPGRQRRGELDSRRRRGVSRWQMPPMKPVEPLGRMLALVKLIRLTPRITFFGYPGVVQESGAASFVPPLFTPPPPRTAIMSLRALSCTVNFALHCFLFHLSEREDDAVRECASLFSSQFRSPN